MKIKIIIYTIAFIWSQTIFSQSPSSPDLTKRTVVSPTSSGMIQYQDIPISLYTGVPSIEIPIYTIKIGEYSMPITLRYHASGIKIAQEASRVGLGWDLSAGGSISRVMREGADEYGYINRLDTISIRNNDEPSYGLRPNIVSDQEPDIYYYNFSNYSGKFYSRKGARKNGTDPQYLLSNPEHNIQISKTTNGYAITTTENVTYFFDKIVYSQYHSVIRDKTNRFVSYTTEIGNTTTMLISMPSSGQPSISQWNLSKILYPTGDYVLFEYGNEAYASPIQFNEQKIRYLQTIPIDISHLTTLPEENVLMATTTFHQTYGRMRLDKIKWKDGELSFIPLNEHRKDVYKNPYLANIYDNPKALSEIQLKSNNNTKNLFTYKFEYSYFKSIDKPGTSNPCNQRLMLTGVRIKGTGNKTKS